MVSQWLVGKGEGYLIGYFHSVIVNGDAFHIALNHGTDLFALACFGEFL